jgi:beta-1,4-N-acetylglucosaminyltransferase
MVVFGSGGHTTEMLMMLDELEPDKYARVYFVIARSDKFSLKKITDFLKTHAKCKRDISNPKQMGNMEIIYLYRSREVKQSYFTSIFTTLIGLVHACFIVVRTRPDIVSFRWYFYFPFVQVVNNGPGTAVPLVYAHHIISKILFWRPEAQQIFIESFCRVTSLSLTGKLIRPLVDKFIVQWDGLVPKNDKSGKYIYCPD